MKPYTIRCYDRYASLRRLALGGGLALGLTIGAFVALPAQGKSQVQTLPRVELHGQRVQIEKLPPVLISGRRASGAEVLLALTDEQAPVQTH